MNQEQNNFNQNNFNTQGNNGIPNNQPLNNNINQGFNNTFAQQQPVMSQQNVQPTQSVSPSTFTQQPQTNNINPKPSRKKSLGLITIITIIVLISLTGGVFIIKNGSTKLFGNKNKIRLYADSLKLVDGDIKKFNLYKQNGNEVSMKIYKISEYLVAYQNLDKEYNYFGFAQYNLNNEKNYILESNSLSDNVENSGHIITDIKKKEKDFTSINDVAVKYGKSNSANEYSKSDAKIEKISDKISKVTSIKSWGEEVYTFFIDIDNSNYFDIMFSCNPVTKCDLQGEQTKSTLKFFENLEIDLINEKEENKSISNNSNNSINNRFQYYFAFKDIDIKKFDKNKSLKNLYDYNGGELTTLPIKYNNLISKYKTYYQAEKYSTYHVETSKANKEIFWCEDNRNCYLEIDFYDYYDKNIDEAMKNHKFYKSLGKSYYKVQLGMSNNNEKSDFDDIIEKLGQPNELYIHSEVYTNNEEANYWLVYNYKDYILAFNFTESSNEDRSKDSPLYIPPHLEDAYYIDGDSFENALAGIKNTSSNNLNKLELDIIIK